MKYAYLIYGSASVLVLGGATLQILHLPGAETAGLINKFVFFGIFAYMIWENAQLKKRVKELEAKD